MHVPWCHKAHNKHLVLVYHENAVLVHFAVKCGRLRSWRYYQIFHHHASRQIKCENQFSKLKPLKCHNGFWIWKLEIAALSEMPCAALLAFVRWQRKGHLEQLGRFCLCLFSSSVGLWETMKFAILTITAPLGLSSLPMDHREFWIQSSAHLDDNPWPNPDGRKTPKESTYMTKSTWWIWAMRNWVMSECHAESAVTPSRADWVIQTYSYRGLFYWLKINKKPQTNEKKKANKKLIPLSR